MLNVGSSSSTMVPSATPSEIDALAAFPRVRVNVSSRLVKRIEWAP